MVPWPFPAPLLSELPLGISSRRSKSPSARTRPSHSLTLARDDLGVSYFARTGGRKRHASKKLTSALGLQPNHSSPRNSTAHRVIRIKVISLGARQGTYFLALTCLFAAVLTISAREGGPLYFRLSCRLIFKAASPFPLLQWSLAVYPGRQADRICLHIPDSNARRRLQAPSPPPAHTGSLHSAVHQPGVVNEPSRMALIGLSPC